MIKAAVFDVGNVLLRWDQRNLYHKIFARPEEMEHFLAEVCTPAWNLEADRGAPWSALIEQAATLHPHYTKEIKAFRERWHEMVSGPIAENVALLETLRHNGVPTFAITNFAADTFAETQQRFAFLKGFDGVICSGEEGVLKPDPAIYRLLLDRYGLTAEACVFIDDSARNIEGARALGFSAVHYTLGIDARLAFRQLGLPV